MPGTNQHGQSLSKFPLAERFPGKPELSAWSWCLGECSRTKEAPHATTLGLGSSKVVFMLLMVVGSSARPSDSTEVV